MRSALNIPAALLLVLALAACSDRSEPRLMNLQSSTDGPDAFALVPTRPLEMPASLDTLPQPAPGTVNRADPNPRADAIAALGGRPGASVAGDAALMSYTTRFGVTPDIRAQLAAADLERRSRNRGRLLERWFGVNTYNQAYRDMALDSQAELQRWRGAGARTPGAPPPR
ncbi:DUF3035 domain-containing protein [Rhodobaculum claviforme]|uniref:Beta-barrel assembly machine subunit BamF n=1 Tax=Rhodobaculum claviforme TaxID=1549854 RepID=A0A934WHU5_9RHOB|nr:DUF3035 domain-containing protein [Rhodobaculum claviforme]MBK5927510.1 hypothetical protein [Rhodobaculum claviforme]